MPQLRSCINTWIVWRYQARLVNHGGMNLKRNARRLLGAITVALLLAGCQQTAPENEIGAGEPDAVLTGETATWQIGNSTNLDRDSTSIDVVVTRLGCSSGVTGETLAPIVTYTSEQIAIRIDVEPFDGDGADCPGNDAVPVVVQLDQPLGERALIDGGCLRVDAANTATCESDLRWPL